MREELKRVSEGMATLPIQMRKALAEEHIQNATNQYVNRLHLIKTLLAVDEVRLATGMGVEDSTFYAIEVNSKTFENLSELNDYASTVGEQMGQKYKD